MTGNGQIHVPTVSITAHSQYLDSKKYSWAPMMLHAMWIVESAYGYLKSTFAKAALFKTVTRILLSQTTIHRKGIQEQRNAFM